MPTKDPIKDKRYLAYITDDKIGLHILPLCGNPHDAMALIGHPAGVRTYSSLTAKALYFMINRFIAVF